MQSLDSADVFDAPHSESTSNSDSSLPNDLLCRLGIHGHIGRVRAESADRISRGDRVLCRTDRGVETGWVMARTPSSGNEPDGILLRRFTTEDDLFSRCLKEFSDRAFESCQKWIQENGLADLLLEVEPLMDGKTLYFHFLGEASVMLGSELDRLVEVYQSEVASSQFAKLLEEGCGPGCGTEEKSGCGPSGGACAVCVVASACHKS